MEDLSIDNGTYHACGVMLFPPTLHYTITNHILRYAKISATLIDVQESSGNQFEVMYSKANVASFTGWFQQLSVHRTFAPY